MIWITVILPEHIRWKDIISLEVQTVKTVKSMVLLFHSDRILHPNGAQRGANAKEIDLKLKTMAQEYFESHYGTREDFRDIFGKSWL